MLQHLSVPQALVQMTADFLASDTRKHWERNSISASSSISHMSLRLVNLRAAIHNGEITKSFQIQEIALEIDRDLQQWPTTVPPTWVPMAIETGRSQHACLGKSRHQYPSSFIAQAWNNWRTLRILINRTLLQHSCKSSLRGDLLVRQLIQKLSIDICDSVPTFTNSSRGSSTSIADAAANTPHLGMMTLIRPLYVVGREKHNVQSVRDFAAAELRRIETDLGVRQAGVLADRASTTGVRGGDRVGTNSSTNLYMTPLVPCG